jgi:uncharacterized membrane protein YfcA
MMLSALGFFIALAVGLTGIGGGSFTVPVLLLIAGLPATAAVGTAFIFAGVLRLIAAPFYLLGRQVHGRYLWGMLKGAIPGLLIGTILLRWMSDGPWAPLVVVVLGLVLAASSGVSFIQRMQNPRFARRNARWFPWLALPIGIESGFSSAGAGALGTVLLLNYSEMTPLQVVGTDIMFGLALALIGSVFHWSVGSLDQGMLVQLLAGGIPGVLLGCAFAQRVPVRRLKATIAVIAMVAASQLIWNGTRSFVANQASSIPAKGNGPSAPNVAIPSPAMLP